VVVLIAEFYCTYKVSSLINLLPPKIVAKTTVSVNSQLSMQTIISDYPVN